MPWSSDRNRSVASAVNFAVRWFIAPPYVVVFTIDDGVPIIFGLRHATSDRKDWFGRAVPLTSGEIG